MQIIAHQTHHQIADFKSIRETLMEIMEKSGEGVHVFSELFLTGYPLQDLCLQASFIQEYQKHLDLINKLVIELPKKNAIYLVGGLEYVLDDSKIPEDIYNVVYKITPGQGLEIVCKKKLLPNYDIFDERKYFTPGTENSIIDFNGKKLALLVCEDMWSSNFHHVDPVEDLYEQAKNEKINIDAVINLSASPFHVGKDESRHQRASFISHRLQAPFVYVNRVGGEDEILFDGSSFVINGDELVSKAKSFIADEIQIDLTDINSDYKKVDREDTSNTWESLFEARLDPKNPTRLRKYSDEELDELLESLAFGVQEYFQKCGFKRFVIALSGGMDSALVLTILRHSLRPGQTLEAIYMPSEHSSTLSYDLSLELCQNLGVKMTTLPIKFMHSTIHNTFEQHFGEGLSGLTDENIQARLRGTLLYTRSNQVNAMVVNTSNKSELAVGYSTQYGDSVGAISLLGDLYKSEVFALAWHINKRFNNIIPEQIITRPPTAELRPDQKDEDSLPPYDVLDAILECLLSYRYSKQGLIDLGQSEKDVDMVINLYTLSEYKRAQFCPIIKVKTKSFGFGYRVPIAKSRAYFKGEGNG